jgi:hypothetical protein
MREISGPAAEDLRTNCRAPGGLARSHAFMRRRKNLPLAGPRRLIAEVRQDEQKKEPKISRCRKNPNQAGALGRMKLGNAYVLVCTLDS